LPTTERNPKSCRHATTHCTVILEERSDEGSAVAVAFVLHEFNVRIADFPPSVRFILLPNMPKKTGSVWNFDPEHLTWPYVLLIPCIFAGSLFIGIATGDFVRWGGLFVFTVFIFLFFISDSSRFFRDTQFWLLTVCLLCIHVAIFIAILLRVTKWSLLWFSIMALELPPFWLMRDLLFRNFTGESPAIWKQPQKGT
jgi:hypothetical protein